MSGHWLITAAQRAGLGDASSSGLPADRPIPQAYDWVANFVGCSTDQLAEAVAQMFRLELADLGAADQSALALVPEKVARALNVLPLSATDREIVVASAEPIDADAEREIGFVSSRRASFRVAAPAAITAAIEKAYSAQQKREAFGGPEMEAAYRAVQPDQATLAKAPPHTRDNAIVKIVRLIVFEAHKAGAAQIHLAPGNSAGRVQFKVDGKLTTFIRIPLETLQTVIERIRGMADLTDVEGREERRLELRIEKQPVRIGIQTVPGYLHHLVLDFGGVAGQARDWAARADEDDGHILVVDDDDGGRLLMRTILEKNGFRVSEADDGGTAIPFLDRAEDVDAILLDLMMRKVDGMEVLQHVRKSRKLAALPVVILTASENPDDENRLLTAGADDYLRKPVDPHQLVQRIHAVMKRAQA